MFPVEELFLEDVLGAGVSLRPPRGFGYGFGSTPLPTLRQLSQEEQAAVAAVKAGLVAQGVAPHVVSPGCAVDGGRGKSTHAVCPRVGSSTFGGMHG